MFFRSTDIFCPHWMTETNLILINDKPKLEGQQKRFVVRTEDASKRSNHTWAFSTFPHLKWAVWLAEPTDILEVKKQADHSD